MKKSTQQLREEQQALESFLESAGYKAAKQVIDSEIQDGINVLLDHPLEENPLKGIIILLEARAEVRANRGFSQRFLSRLEEIKQLLSESKEPVDDDVT